MAEAEAFVDITRFAWLFRFGAAGDEHREQPDTDPTGPVDRARARRFHVQNKPKSYIIRAKSGPGQEQERCHFGRKRLLPSKARRSHLDLQARQGALI